MARSAAASRSTVLHKNCTGVVQRCRLFNLKSSGSRNSYSKLLTVVNLRKFVMVMRLGCPQASTYAGIFD